MDIAEVARRSGIAASALRFYESKGLIRSLGPARGRASSPPGRRSGEVDRPSARRRFAPSVLDQLALIALGQAAGFSLDEIGAMFTADGQPAIDRQMLLAKADDIDRTIRRLKAMSDGLRHAAVCPAPSHAECPTFRRLLTAATARAVERRERVKEPAGNGPSAPSRRR